MNGIYNASIEHKQVQSNNYNDTTTKTT